MKIKLRKIVEYLVRLSLENQKTSFIIVELLAVLFWTSIFIGVFFYMYYQEDSIIEATSISGVLFLMFGVPYYDDVLKTADRKLLELHAIYLENLDDDLEHPLSKL